MFGKKKKMKLMLLDESKTIIDERTVDDIILKEEYIIAESKKKYGTNEPCIIYRTCIADDVHLQLNEFFKECMSNNKNQISIDEIPEIILTNLEMNDSVKYIDIIL